MSKKKGVKLPTTTLTPERSEELDRLFNTSCGALDRGSPMSHVDFKK